ncbi:MAG: hypothetical protein IPK83_10330 [Planctomycetes bacterium]|nr:hypothetical protein [Planctomycetota bacterium]
MPNGAKAFFRRIFAQRQVRTTAPVETATVAAPARRGIRLAMLAIETFYTPARTNTVDQLLDYVRQADARFAAEDNPFNDQELRIFLAPEWYFRNVGTPFTHADMRAIVEELRLKTAAAEFRIGSSSPAQFTSALALMLRWTTPTISP